MNLSSLFKFVIITSAYASIVGIVILAVKLFAGHKLSAKWNYLLWTILLFKLIVPFGPESSVSLFNVAKPPIIINQAETDISNNFRAYSLQQSDVTMGTPIPAKSKPKVSDAVPIIWLLGCVIMLIWFVATNISLSRKLKYNLPANKRITSVFNACKEKMNIKKDIELIMQCYILSPSLFGTVKPKILVSKAIETLSDKEIEYVFLHELSHYKHRDIFINYILLIFQMIHWFNPIMWYCFRKIRRDMELAADEKALSYLDNTEYKDYGKALLAVVENFSSSKVALNLLGMADQSKNITQRVKKISKFKKPKIMASIVAIVIIAMVGVICLTGAQSVSIANPDTDNKQDEETVVANTESGIELKIQGTDKDNHHQLLNSTDLLAIINELNAGGASYILINDIPVNASTAIDDRLINISNCTIKAWEGNLLDISQSNNLYGFMIREHGFLNALIAYGFEITVDEFSGVKQPNQKYGEINNYKEKPFIITISDGEQNRVYDTDILLLKNEMYQHGAETITVNDITILKDSYFSCSDYLMMNGQILNPPYTLKAYGNYKELSEKMYSNDVIKMLLSCNLSINIDGGSVIAVTGTERGEIQPKDLPVPTSTPTPSQAPVSTLPVQAIRPESGNAGKVSANSYRVLPGTKVEHMKEYLETEDKAQIAGTLIPLKNNYGYITKSDTKTVTTDDTATVNLYGKSDSADLINIVVVDKSTNKAVSSIGFSLSQNNYYSITGLEKNSNYDVSITVAESSNENYILIY